MAREELGVLLSPGSGLDLVGVRYFPSPSSLKLWLNNSSGANFVKKSRVLSGISKMVPILFPLRRLRSFFSL